MNSNDKWLDVKNSEHWQLLTTLFDKIKDYNINTILDAGSGKTSLSILLEYYNNPIIDAIVYPGDSRKINSIKENIISDRYTLVEKDICSSNIEKQYDLVLAHLLLGEAVKWGHKVDELLEQILSINSKYYVIYDIKEDTSIDYNHILNYLKENNYEILYKDEILKKEPQTIDDFIAKTYIGILITKR